MADKIPPDDTSATTAKSGKTASTPGHRPHLCSDGSPPPLTTPAAPPTAWPPSAPDKYSGQLSDPSNDEGSPSLLFVPISTGFQRVPTPLGRSPTLPVAAISPPRLRNSFSALDDGNNPPLLVERVPPSAPSPIPAGWDAFAATRADNPSLATVDVMFKDFADFTGRLLQDYHRASNHVATKLTRLEQEWQHDRNTIVSSSSAMDELRDIVTESNRANAKAISEVTESNRANAKAILDLVAAINDTHSYTDELRSDNAKTISDLLAAINDTPCNTDDLCTDMVKNLTQFTQRIGSVKTTADDAKGIGNNARVLAGNVHKKVTLFANAVDRHNTQLGELCKLGASVAKLGQDVDRLGELRELGVSVAKLGQEVVDLRASIQRQPPAMDTSAPDMGATGTQVVDELTGAHGKSPPGSLDCTGLDLNASPHADRSTALTETADRTAATAPVRQPNAPPGSPSHPNVDGTHTQPGFPTRLSPTLRARNNWYPPGIRIQHVNPGDDRYPCNHDLYPRDHDRYPRDHLPPHHQSRRPYPIGAMDRMATYDIPIMGGLLFLPVPATANALLWNGKPATTILPI
jgi:hypothetical protein